MDVRDSVNPVVLSAVRWLDKVNARHPWNHNEHFHSPGRCAPAAETTSSAVTVIA